MLSLKWLEIECLFVAFILLPFVLTYPQDEPLDQPQAQIRPGKYVPELHGADLGKYVPDYRGMYTHIHVPYDGGYGDRGEKYQHDLSGIFKRDFTLGPKDHLRFMLDFNSNGTGWQVIRFEWLRDGEEDMHYYYVKKKQMWESQNAAYDFGNGGSDQSTDDERNVHVDGEIETNSDNQINQKEEQQPSIQDTLRKILKFIDSNIIPTLN